MCSRCCEASHLPACLPGWLQELRDLFRLDAEEAQRSATQRALHDMHAHQRRATAELAAHLQFLEGLEGFAGQ